MVGVVETGGSKHQAADLKRAISRATVCTWVGIVSDFVGGFR